MKVKKFPQSHLVITKNGKNLIIDPGYITFDPSALDSEGKSKNRQVFTVEQFQGADVYLITHQHADHLGPETIKQIAGEKPVYGNSDVVKKLKEAGVSNAKEIKNLEEVEIAGFKIKAVDLPHFKKPGFTMPPNTGFLIDGVFFHPGDGDKAPDIVSPNAAVPIAGWTITYQSALEFIKGIGAKVVIPIHYDWYSADPEEFKKLASGLGIDVRPLNFGEETEI